MPKELKLAGITGVEAANAFIREIYLPAHNARFAVEPAHAGSAFVPIQGVELDEILCLQEERQVINDNCVSLPDAENCRSPRARCGPTSSRCWSRSMFIPTARTPSSTGPAALAATTRKEGSGKTIPLAPLKCARRRADARGNVDDASPRPKGRQGEQNQKKRTYDALPKPDNFIRY